MGQPAICSTATSIVQRPVRLHAVAVKLACRKSAFNRSNAQLQAARFPARTASCRTKTVMGLPIPIIGPLFNPFFAAIAYALGAARFWSNYDKTSFDGTQKTKLTALWPILAIGSKNFRDELKKTLN